jgi:rhamnulokinase
MATTSQLYNPWTHGWEPEIFAALGVSPALMQAIVPPGASVGALSPEVCAQTGLPAVPVIAPATHDTGSAVAATPADGEDWAFISSGTWSLMGVEIRRPICSEAARAANFTNEGGVAGTFRFLKNVMGLWLVQQCRRSWATRQELGYAELTQLAAEAPAFRSILAPDWSGFLNPPDMPAAINAFCAAVGQPAPASPGQYVRAILESLALAYRQVLEQLEQVTGRRIATIHILGGGSRNELLCQLTADATGRVVLAGPVEATAMGNVLAQAMALGRIASLAELREVVRRSCEARRYDPAGNAGWDAAYRLFCDLDAEPRPR